MDLNEYRNASEQNSEAFAILLSCESLLNVLRDAGPELLNCPGDCVSGNRLRLTHSIRLLYGSPGHTMCNHIRTPNDNGFECRGGLPNRQRNHFWWSRQSHNVAAHSKQVRGVRSFFCDGHVLFVSSSVDPGVRQALEGRSEGEVVGEF